MNIARTIKKLEAALTHLLSQPNADALACQLAREKVTGKCGDIRRCVLAQYFADKSGAIVSVGGGIEAYASEKDFRNGDSFWSADTDAHRVLSDLISRFDDRQYPFLIRRRVKKS